MMRIALPGGGEVQVTLPGLEEQLLMSRVRFEVAAEAEQRALSMVYRLYGEPDPALPFGGLLTNRLQVSVSTAQRLLASGQLRFTTTAKKAYRVTERACREYLGDL